jgi:hypothetical protein
MKPLYIALIVIGCLIVVAAAVVIPLVFLVFNKTDPTVTSSVVPTGPPGPPGPPVPPVPPVPPTPTVVYPRYVYSVYTQNSDTNSSLYIVDTQADPPVMINPNIIVPLTAAGCMLSQDEKFLYIYSLQNLVVMNLSMPTAPTVSTNISFNSFSIPDLINCQAFVSNPDGTRLFLGMAGRSSAYGGMGGGIAVLKTSDFSLVQWLPALPVPPRTSPKFFDPNSMIMNRNGQILYAAVGGTWDSGSYLTLLTFVDDVLTYFSTLKVSDIWLGIAGMALSTDSKFLYTRTFDGNYDPQTRPEFTVIETATLSLSQPTFLDNQGFGLYLKPSGTLAIVPETGYIAGFNILGAKPSFITTQGVPNTNYPRCAVTDKYAITFGSTGIYFSRINTDPIFSDFTLLSNVSGGPYVGDTSQTVIVLG